MQLHPLPTRSILLAPFASIPVVTLTGLNTSSAGAVSEFFFGLFLGVVVALPAAWLGMVLVGLPLFILLRSFPKLLLASASVAGVAVPCLLFPGAPREMLTMVSATGLAVGVTAWLLRPRPPEPEAASD